MKAVLHILYFDLVLGQQYVVQLSGDAGQLLASHASSQRQTADTP